MPPLLVAVFLVKNGRFTHQEWFTLVGAAVGVDQSSLYVLHLYDNLHGLGQTAVLCKCSNVNTKKFNFSRNSLAKIEVQPSPPAISQIAPAAKASPAACRQLIGSLRKMAANKIVTAGYIAVTGAIIDMSALTAAFR